MERDTDNLLAPTGGETLKNVKAHLSGDKKAIKKPKNSNLKKLKPVQSFWSIYTYTILSITIVIFGHIVKFLILTYFISAIAIRQRTIESNNKILKTQKNKFKLNNEPLMIGYRNQIKEENTIIWLDLLQIVLAIIIYIVWFINRFLI